MVGLIDGVTPVFEDRKQIDHFEDYNRVVYEYLFRIVDGSFELLGVQVLDENNIDKHNPRPPDYRNEWVQ